MKLTHIYILLSTLLIVPSVKAGFDKDEDETNFRDVLNDHKFASPYNDIKATVGGHIATKLGYNTNLKIKGVTILNPRIALGVWHRYPQHSHTGLSTNTPLLWASQAYASEVTAENISPWIVSKIKENIPQAVKNAVPEIIKDVLQDKLVAEIAKSITGIIVRSATDVVLNSIEEQVSKSFPASAKKQNPVKRWFNNLFSNKR